MITSYFFVVLASLYLLITADFARKKSRLENLFHLVLFRSGIYAFTAGLAEVLILLLDLTFSLLSQWW